MKWFRLYHDMPADRKLLKFSAQQKWAWVVLLCVASESKQRGYVLNESDDEMAEYCDFDSPQDYQFFLDKLRQKGMIEHCSGGFKISHWEERQYEKESDKPNAVRERVRRHREKKKLENETPCNALHQQSNALVTPCNVPDTDTDPDQIQIADPEKEQIKDPYKSPSATAAPPNPEPLLSSLRESENTLDVDFWEEVVQSTPRSDSQNPPSRTPENNGQELIVEYDTPQPLLGAFKQGKSDSNAKTQEQTSLLLFSSTGVAVYSAAPETISQKKKTRKKTEYTADFEQFWAIYPRNEDKLKAFTSWQKIDFEEVSLDLILNSLRKQMVYHFDVQRKDISFFKMAVTWINNECWNNKVPDSRLTEIKPKTAAEIRDEEKQREREARQAEFYRLRELDRESP